MKSNEIAARAKKLRGDISQKEFANRLGFSQNYICQIENSQVKPSLDILFAMSRYSRVSIDYILTGENFSDEGIDLNRSLVAKYPDVTEPALKSTLKSFDSLLTDIKKVTKTILTVNQVELTKIKRGDQADIINSVVLLKNRGT